MNVNFKIAIAFISGISIGAFTMKKYMDYKFTQEYEEVEVDDSADTIEEYDYSNDLEEAFVEKEETENGNTPEQKIEYNKIKSVNDAEYTRLLDELRYSVDKEAELNAAAQEEYIEPDPIDRTKPYYIPQDQFEEIDEFESDEYTYYADGYLTDVYGFPVSDEDINSLIGSDFPKYFIEYGGDQIWIRNEQRNMDFSIIKDLDNFEDVAPPRVKRMVGL